MCYASFADESSVGSAGDFESESELELDVEAGSAQVSSPSSE